MSIFQVGQTEVRRSNGRAARLAALAPFLLGGLVASAGCAAEELERDGVLMRGDEGPEVEEVHRYLSAYGYLPNPALSKHPGWTPAIAAQPASPQTFDAALEQALVLFQQTYGLPADGTLNAPTRQLMARPRCGFPDHYSPNRRKRGDGSADFVAIERWPSSSLTYSHANYTPDLAPSVVQSAVSNAFGQWASASPALSFTALGSGGDIVISFGTGDHGDGYPFDGPNGVLAHAFYPLSGGDVHFDDAETWTANGVGGFDILSVTIHELGHSLGLGHSSSAGAIMQPYYSGQRSLGSDDVAGIQSLYSPPSGGAPAAPDPIENSHYYCMGQNEVFWTGKPGATYYQLHRSFSSSFTSPSVIYSGAGTSSFLNVSTGSTWYLRAKACNSAGCSPYSAQVSAWYHSGICL